MRMSLRAFLGLALFVGASDARQVHVNLTTSYLSSHLHPVLETSEFLSQEDPAIFFSYLGAVDVRLNAVKDKKGVDYRQLALESAADVLPPSSALTRLLPFVLDTRAFSPAIEMFNQLAIESFYKACPEQKVSAWAVIYHDSGCADHVVCDIKDFTPSMLSKTDTADTQQACAASGQHDFQLPVDHVFPNAKRTGSAHVIVYGTPTTPSFRAFHSTFLPLATAGDISYIVRHAPQDNTLPVAVQGYGVTLNIKNMEYKTIDDSKDGSGTHKQHHATPTDDDEDEFIVSVMTKKKEEVAKALREYQLEFEDVVDEDEEADFDDLSVTPWQLSQLGYLATQNIMTAEDPLKRLQLLSQNFPKYAATLALSPYPILDEIREEMNHARGQVTAKRLNNRLVINGLPVDLNEYGFNAFDLLKTMTGELRLMDTLRELDPSGAIKSAMASMSSQTSDVRVSVRGPVDGNAPLYLNSIETDDITADWPTDISSLRGPSWNLIYLRKTMYEVILVVDPTSKVGIEALSEVNYLRMRQAPVQFGVLWTSKEFLTMTHEERRAYKPSLEEKSPANVFHFTKLFHAARKHSKTAADEFLREFLSLKGEVTVKESMMIYTQAIGNRYSKDTWAEDAKELLHGDEDNEHVWAMTDLVRSKNLPVNSHIFNGVVRPHVNVQEEIMSHFGRDQPLYQSLVRDNKITDDADMLNELLGSEAAYAVHCPWFDSKYEVPKIDLNWKDEAWKDVGAFHAAGTATKPKRQNVVVLANLDTPYGAQSAYQALKSVADNPEIRVSIIHTAPPTTNTLGNRVAFILSQIGHTDSTTYSAVILEVLRLMTKKSEADALTHGRLFLQLHVDAHPKDSVLGQFAAWLTETPLFRHPLLAKAIEYKHAVLINGRPLELEETPLSAELFDGLVQYEFNFRSKTVSKAYVSQFKHDELSVADAADRSHAFYHIVEAVDQYLKTPRVTPAVEELLPSFAYETKTTDASAIDIVAYLDPLSETAQRASGILRMLESTLGAKITLVLLAAPSYDEFPLKRFYRFLWGSHSASQVEFQRLPRQPVLTMNLETPELWNVQMIRSDTDVDNIQHNASATYYIKDVLVYGQCMDRTTPHYPSLPNGLQLVLERTAGTLSVHKDTVVMKNLGYFQLQAAPGVWQLGLAKGRHSTIYEMIDEEERVNSVRVVVYDFMSSIMQLEVKKRVGQESVRLLDDSNSDNDAENKAEKEEEKSYWSSLVNWGTKKPESTRTGDTIHVFSLATGHLYERMLKLMMLSVLKRTNNPVTFWLLENFLSPDFKNSVPVLQAEFGMDIRLITYKWPNWLRRQTEKQHILFRLAAQSSTFFSVWRRNQLGQNYSYYIYC
ncbi:Aste57867_15229 [Aphanomyces stellatus]|uniref:Aste57867_15229 protein n=1 Tax=Aphanomyces stellatus TaxID=120398 RepID=A0A485L3Y4_9STRA|nr:hypothetical protein As57867_015173 [Aphanomyces stellatus]VFT92038.1 Aste57867_15229 [Aphanomyces stellatus]